ncbi:MAG: acyltransferase [Oscillospiraceae bacterium]
MQYTELIFVFLFIPATVILSFLDKSAEYKNLILVLASVLFFTWGKPFAVALVFLSVLADWLLGLAAGGLKPRGLRFAAAGVDLLINGALFVVLGWSGLFNPGQWLGGITALNVPDSLLPIGMTVWTLRGFSYVYDVYTGRIRSEKNFFCLLTYMLNFHLMLAGPIVRYGELSAQIRKRRFSSAQFSKGLTRFVIGLSKILIAASALGALRAAGIGTNEDTFFGAWLGILGFIGQFFFTYTGLADLSIGMGLLFGFTYPENFAPVSLRGGVSGILSGFNTTLVRLTGDVLLKNKLTAKSKPIAGLALIAGCVFIALWYAFSRHMLAAGLLAAALIILEQCWLKKKLAALPAAVSALYSGIAMLAIFALVCFDDKGDLLHWARMLVGAGTDYLLSVRMKYTFLSNLAIYAVCAAYVILPVRRAILAFFAAMSKKSPSALSTLRIAGTAATCVLLLVCAAKMVIVR